MAIVTKSFAVDGLDGFSVEIEATTLRGIHPAPKQQDTHFLSATK